MRCDRMAALSLGLFAFFSGAAPALARDYFIAPDGAGEEYSPEHPGSLTALNTLKIDPGQAHRFILADGVYDLSQVEYADVAARFQKRDPLGRAAIAFGLYSRPHFLSASGDPAKCILDGGRSGKGRAMSVANPIVEGITFRNFTGSDDAGAMLPVWAATVSNCVFEANSAKRGGAVSRGSYYDCVFRDNRAEECGGAMYGAAEVRDCRFEDNFVMSGKGTGAAAAGLYPWAQPALADCVFERNHAAGDPVSEQVVGKYCSVTNCVFRDNDDCVYGRRDGGPYVNSIRVKPGDDLRAVIGRLRRERDPKGKAEIVFADGRYYFAPNSYLRLDRRDQYLTFRAEHPGKVVFTGAYEWKLSDFRPVTDPKLLRRLSPYARKHVVAVDLTPEQLAVFRIAAVGGTDGAGGVWVGSNNAPYFNGTLRRLDRGDDRRALVERCEDYPAFAIDDMPEPAARWPNENEFELKARQFTTNGVTCLRLNSERPADWDWEHERIGIVGKPNPWGHMSWPVSGWSREYSAVITGVCPGQAYFENVLEELDRPGEWCVDYVTSRLCYFPRRGAKGTQRCALSHTVEPFIAADNVIELVFSGIEFAHKVTFPPVVIANGERCRIERCRFVDLNYLGLDLSGWTNTVRECEFFNVLNGISLAGGSVPSLTHGNNLVENCLFENRRLNRRSGNGIGLIGCGNIIRHSVFLHHPHGAIDFGGPHHLIEYNRIVDTCSQNGDCGALYGWGKMMSIGSVIRYNDIVGSLGWGIYLDDGTSGVTVHGNVLRELPGWSIFLGGGRDLVISDNVMYHAGGIQLDNRGLWWPSFANYEAEHESLIRGLNYTGGVWLAQHPNVAHWHDDGTNMFAHTDNVFANNLQLNDEREGQFCLAEYRGLLGPPGRLKSAGNVVVRRAARWHVELKPWRIGGVEQFEGFVTNAIDYGFVEAPPPVELGREFHYRRGDFTLRPDAWLRTHVPQWEPVPFRKIGFTADSVLRGRDPETIDWWMGGPSRARKRYFVSPKGSGDEYTFDHPGRLEAILDAGVLKDDNALILYDGVYDLSSGEYRTVASAFGDHRQYGKSRFNHSAAKLVIRSASGDPSKCILDGGNSGKGRAFTLSGGSISGITFRNFACPDSVGGALLWLWDGTVSNCVFEANSAQCGGAVSRGTYLDCVFSRNRSSDAGSAIAGAGLVCGCRFADNFAVSNAVTAIDYYPFSIPQFSNCVFCVQRTDAAAPPWSRWCKDLGGNVVK